VYRLGSSGSLNFEQQEGSMGEEKERRKAERTAMRQAIRVKTNADQAARRATLRNLSQNGLYFEIDANLRRGSTVDCHIALDGEGPLRDCLAIHCQASVVRAEPLPTSPNCLEVGARIVSLSITKAAAA
jgi:hypothetical protein